MLSISPNSPQSSTVRCTNSTNTQENPIPFPTESRLIFSLFSRAWCVTESVGTPFVVVAQRILQGLDAGCRTHLCDMAPTCSCEAKRCDVYILLTVCMYSRSGSLCSTDRLIVTPRYIHILTLHTCMLQCADGATKLVHLLSLREANQVINQDGSAAKRAHLAPRIQPTTPPQSRASPWMLCVVSLVIGPCLNQEQEE